MKLPDYERIYDNNGQFIGFIDSETGEYLNAVSTVLPEGSLSYTPKQQKRYKEKRAMAEINGRGYRKKRSDEPHYYFVYGEERFIDVSPASAARLIYLNTFLNYNDNRIMRSERRQMCVTDLPEVLNVSKATATRFFSEVTPKYIYADDNGLLYSNRDLFLKGLLEKKQYTFYQKFCQEGVRKLYENTPASKCKHLGYLFQLLPFINKEYNLICAPECVEEKDLSAIRLLSMEEFCSLIDYDVTHLNRLVAAYREICFNVNGRRQRFCSLSYDGINRRTANIYINPNILYNGSDFKKVELLGAFCIV